MLRSQLLVLLQSRAVCNSQGHILQPPVEEPEYAEAGGKRRASLDARMRAFFTRPRFRYRCLLILAALKGLTGKPVLQTGWHSVAVHACLACPGNMCLSQ